MLRFERPLFRRRITCIVVRWSRGLCRSIHFGDNGISSPPVARHGFRCLISMASMLSVVPMTNSTYTWTDEMGVLYAAMWQIESPYAAHTIINACKVRHLTFDRLLSKNVSREKLGPKQALACRVSPPNPKRLASSLNKGAHYLRDKSGLLTSSSPYHHYTLENTITLSNTSSITCSPSLSN